jgi:hypothetical protein
MSEERAVIERTAGLSSQELALEGGELLPDKEVLSVLDLFVNLDLALDLAAPVDLAVAANANAAVPIDAAASANILSVGSESGALAEQDAIINQHIAGEAIATAPQDSDIDQSNDVVDDGTTDGGAVVEDPTAGGTLDGPLLNVNVDVALDADAAAPIAGAVAANANVAAPIDAAVSANIGTVDSESTAIADQTAVINQDLDGVTADATADQDATITQ